MPADEMDLLPSRETLLGGMPERRAAAALLLIESRTAHMAARARREGVPLPFEDEVVAREEAYIQAFSHSAGPRQTVSIQQIEQYASSWALLVPDPAQIRAAIAHRLAGKYVFGYLDIPAIRRELGLDDAAVGDAFRTLYAAPIASIYAPRVPLSARPAWYWQRFSTWTERLHPFWLAFALTLPLGPGLMALPIALAHLRPVVALTFIGVIALVNMATAAAMAEAVARSGIMRYGQGYLGQMAADWLGPSGSAFLTFALAFDGLLILPVFYLGIATTLAEATHLGSPLWVAVIFVVGLYFMTRRTLTTTVATILVITAINVVILVLIPALALTNFSGATLSHAGSGLTLGSIQLVFGVLLSNFFSHQQIANYGRVVIRRDSGARWWVRGSLAAIVATALVSAAWVLTVDGALPAHDLQTEKGTVVVALTEHVTRLIAFPGSALVILSLGLSTIHISLALLFTAKERLPARLREHPQLGLILPIAPVGAVFAVTEWLAISGIASFSSLLGFITVMTLTTLGAFVSILLVLVGRRKSDVALDVKVTLFQRPAVLGFLYITFLAVVFAYGLFVWTVPLQRAITLLAACTIALGTLAILRRNSLHPRLIVEVRCDEGGAGPPVYSILCSGEPYAGRVVAETDDGTFEERAAAGRLPSLLRLRRVHIQLPSSRTRELKVWVHSVSSIGESAAVPSIVHVGAGADGSVADLSLSNGWVVLSVEPGEVALSIDFGPVPAGPASLAATFLTHDA